MHCIHVISQLNYNKKKILPSVEGITFTVLHDFKMLYTLQNGQVALYKCKDTKYNSVLRRNYGTNQ